MWNRDWKNEFLSRIIPFIGYGTAIQEIRGKNGEVLYKNPSIPDNYDLREEKDIDQLKSLSFGREIII